MSFLAFYCLAILMTGLFSSLLLVLDYKLFAGKLPLPAYFVLGLICAGVVWLLMSWQDHSTFGYADTGAYIDTGFYFDTGSNFEPEE